MKTKQELQSEFYRLRDEIQVLENLERRAENQKLVGSCYKYRNNYGSGDPGWWMYLKVKKLDEHGGLVSDVFQVCSYDEYSFKTQERYSISSEFIEITPAEYNKELKKFLAKLQKAALTK